MDKKTAGPSAYQAMLEESRQRRQMALDLKKEGKTNKEIGVELGVSEERARQILAAAQKAATAAAP